MPRSGCSALLDGWPRRAAPLVACGVLVACTAARAPALARAPGAAATPAPAAARGPWIDDGDPRALRRAADEALAALERRPADPSTDRLVRTLRLLRETLALPAAALPAALAARFRSGPADGVFVTGYHEPLLAARRERDERFRYALYRMPGGGGPLPSRAAIEEGALAGRGLELYWTDDPVELFFLHVQGSGRLRLEDGTTVAVSFAGSNGQPYRAIGAVLVERGVFRREEATAPAIKAYLRAHPDEAPGIMRLNPRYVFFRERPARADEGPPGALGVPLVAFRSVAVDPKVVPLGSVGHLRVPLPSGETFSGLVVAMDAGAAIAGAGRLDLYCGGDARGARIAGELRHHGELVWLVPRP